MSEKYKIPLSPGGVNSDVSPNRMGYSEWQTVQNLKLNREGEWVNDKGYAGIASLAANVLSAIEVTDDVTGARFIIYHAGTLLYRMDYHPTTFYTVAAPVALTTPAGVTLLITDKLRYHWYAGVLRIMGASHVMRYEYISRTLMSGAVTVIDRDTFAADVEGWAGTDATVTAPVEDLLVEKTGANGYAWKQFTTISGRTYRLTIYDYSLYGHTIRVGKTVDADDYDTDNVPASAVGIDDLYYLEFTATGTALFVTFDPDEGGTHSGWMRSCLLEIVTAPLVTAGWTLSGAAATPATALELVYVKEINTVFNGNTARNTKLQAFFVYDGGQYSLPFDIKIFDPYGIDVLNSTSDFAGMLVCIADAVFANPRITGVGIIAEVTTVLSGSTSIKYITELIDFASGLATVSFFQAFMYLSFIDVLEPGNLYITNTLAVEGFNGTPAWLLNLGYLAPGNIVTLTNAQGTVTGEIWNVACATNDLIDDGNTGKHLTMVSIYADLSPLLSSGVVVLENVTVSIQRRWIREYAYYKNLTAETVPGAYYSTWVLLDMSGGSPDYYALTGIPAGTSKTDYDYSDIEIIDGRSFVVSTLEGEGDVIRYSPTGQPDVLPLLNYMQAEIGDRDSIKRIAAINDRLIILKRKSISRAAVYGGNIDMDIRFAERGLYCDEGLIVIDNALYFMDSDNVYIFDGTTLAPWLDKQKVRKMYAAALSSTSFFSYNKLENEIWLHLNGFIMAYSFTHAMWTTRLYTTMPYAWFADFENHSIGIWAGATLNFKDFNHAGTVNPASMTIKFVTRLIDTENPEQFKKIVSLIVYMKSSAAVVIKVTDTDGGTSSSVTVTPSSTYVAAYETVAVKKLFKNCEIEVSCTGAATAMTVRNLLAEVQKWR